MSKTTERVEFRLMQMPCCGQLQCHVNPRLPNFCSECGDYVLPKIKQSVLAHDIDATLTTTYDLHEAIAKIATLSRPRT